MNVTLKRHFLLALMIVYVFTTLYFFRIQGVILPREFMISFPLLCLIFFPPFRFSRERVSFENNQLRLNEGEHLHTEISFEQIARIEGHSLLGVLPILTVVGKDNSQMVLSMKAEGVLELEDSLLSRISGGGSLHEFFRFYRILISETVSLEKAMITWIRLSVLFGVVTPVLLWDDGLIAEQVIVLTLIWFALTAGSAFFVLIFFAVFNRLLLTISADWAERHISTFRVWALFILFLAYLITGNRFSYRFFS